MNPLDLNKEPEIVTNEVTELIEMTEAIEAKEVIEVEEVIEKTETNEVAIVDELTETTETNTTVEAVEVINTTTSESNSETVVPERSNETESDKPDYNSLSKSELIDALRLLLDKEVDAVKDQVETIKQLFYKKTKSEIEEQKKLFIENGGEETDFLPSKDEMEETFKSLLNAYKAKKASYLAKLESDKETNLIQKQHLLEQMKALAESNDDVSTHVNEFRTLQQKWKSIGNVPQSASTELWKQYNLYQESFWDLIKINNELREYDFKKNLEAKTLLCEAAERLANETDVISAFQQLQKLHEEWHDTGPVSRELREQIWLRFKDASTAINKKHQSHFDSIRKLKKTIILQNWLCAKKSRHLILRISTTTKPGMKVLKLYWHGRRSGEPLVLHPEK
jgi:hypothetical protein